MPAIRIVVSAAGDSSLSTVFDPLVSGAKKARAIVARETTASAARSMKSDADVAKSQQRLTGLIHAESVRRSRNAGKEFDERLRSAQRAAKEEQRYFASVTKEVEREEAQRTRTTEREAKKRASAQVKATRQAESKREDRIDSFKKFGSNSLSNMAATGRFAAGVASSVLHGTGVDFSIGSQSEKSTHMQKTITDTVNSAASANGQAGTIEQVRATEAAVKDAANESATDYNKMSEGLMEFIQRSSDLKTGTAILKDMGQLARATGTDVGQIMEAAGPIAKVFEGQANEAERVGEAMRLIAKQGAMGNVEMRQLAPYMGRLAASVNKYADPSKGVSRDKVLGQLGAVTQIAMQGGGINAAEASGAAANFGRDLAKKQTLKAFKSIMGADYSVFTDKNQEHMKLPEQLMMDVLKKTHGNQAQISQLFRNTSSAKGMLGVQAEYEKAGGGDAGLKHVQELFDRFGQTLEKEEVSKAAALSQDTGEAKATLFNNKLQDMAEKLSSKLLPALERLEPSVLRLADAFIKIVDVAASNPGAAIAAAVVGSIAKAGIGQAVAGALSNLTIGASSAATTLGAVALAGAALVVAYEQWKGLMSDVAQIEESEKGYVADAGRNALRQGSGPVQVDTGFGKHWVAPVRNADGSYGGHDFGDDDGAQGAAKEQYDRTAADYKDRGRGDVVSPAQMKEMSDKTAHAKLDAIAKEVAGLKTAPLTVKVSNMPGQGFAGPGVDPAGVVK